MDVISPLLTPLLTLVSGVFMFVFNAQNERIKDLEKNSIRKDEVERVLAHITKSVDECKAEAKETRNDVQKVTSDIYKLLLERHKTHE